MRLITRMVALGLVVVLTCPSPVFALREKATPEKQPGVLVGLEEALHDPNAALTRLAQLTSSSVAPVHPDRFPTVRPERVEGRTVHATGLEERPERLGVKAWMATAGLWGPTREALRRFDEPTQTALRGPINRLVKAVVKRQASFGAGGVRSSIIPWLRRAIPTATRSLTDKQLTRALKFMARVVVSDQHFADGWVLSLLDTTLPRLAKHTTPEQWTAAVTIAAAYTERVARTYSSPEPLLQGFLRAATASSDKDRLSNALISSIQLWLGEADQPTPEMMVLISHGVSPLIAREVTRYVSAVPESIAQLPVTQRGMVFQYLGGPNRYPWAYVDRQLAPADVSFLQGVVRWLTLGSESGASSEVRLRAIEFFSDRVRESEWVRSSVPLVVADARTWEDARARLRIIEDLVRQGGTIDMIAEAIQLRERGRSFRVEIIPGPRHSEWQGGETRQVSEGGGDRGRNVDSEIIGGELVSWQDPEIRRLVPIGRGRTDRLAGLEEQQVAQARELAVAAWGQAQRATGAVPAPISQTVLVFGEQVLEMVPWAVAHGIPTAVGVDGSVATGLEELLARLPEPKAPYAIGMQAAQRFASEYEHQVVVRSRTQLLALVGLEEGALPPAETQALTATRTFLDLAV